MDKKEALKILNGIKPSQDNDISRAIQVGIDSISGNSNVKEVHIQVTHHLPIPKLPFMTEDDPFTALFSKFLRLDDDNKDKSSLG